MYPALGKCRKRRFRVASLRRRGALAEAPSRKCWEASAVRRAALWSLSCRLALTGGLDRRQLFNYLNNLVRGARGLGKKTVRPQTRRSDPVFG